MPDDFAHVKLLRWPELSGEHREALTGKLVGLWGAVSDASAFETLDLDAQQALFLIISRMTEKDLWWTVRKIRNVWGAGGVGFEFSAWPVIESALSARKDFTRRFAKHRNTDGGFYEKGSPVSIMHFLFVNKTPREWSFHFDLYSPLHSPLSAWKHLQHEVLAEVKPDWRRIKRALTERQSRTHVKGSSSHV